MKTKTLPLFLLAMMLWTGCMQTRYITEQYIKTKIETHTPGTTSSIRTYSIFKSTASSSTSHYLELTGFKYNGTKGLVIGADRYYDQRAKLTGLPLATAEITYIVLDEVQCKALLDSEPLLRAELKKVDRPEASEEIYQDYTIVDDLFISYKRSMSNSNTSHLNVWIDGEKYNISSRTFIRKLKKFIEY